MVRSARNPAMRFPSWVPEDETHRALFVVRQEAKRLGSYKPEVMPERKRSRFSE